MPATGLAVGLLWGGTGLGAAMLALALIRRYGQNRRRPTKS